MIAEATIGSRCIAGHPSDAIIAVTIIAHLLTLGEGFLAHRRILRIGRARRGGEEDQTKKGVSHAGYCPSDVQRESRRPYPQSFRCCGKFSGMSRASVVAPPAWAW